MVNKKLILAAKEACGEETYKKICWLDRAIDEAHSFEEKVTATDMLMIILRDMSPDALSAVIDEARCLQTPWLPRAEALLGIHYK